MKKQYLGDGVYIEEDPYGGVILTTSDGEQNTNKVYLSIGQVQKMDQYTKDMENEA